MQYFTPLLPGLLLLAGLTTYFGYRNSAVKKNSFGLTPHLFPLGIFVWGDAVTIGPFWVAVAVIGYLTQNPYLVLLFISLFWLVRAYGEVQYWLHEQFAFRHRNPPKSLYCNALFEGEAVWFGYQTFWQVVMVFASVATILVAKMWIAR